MAKNLDWQSNLDRENGEFWGYNADDVEGTWISKEFIEQDLTYYGAWRTHDEMLRISRAAYASQEYGMLVDVEKRKALLADVRVQLEKRNLVVSGMWKFQVGPGLEAARAVGGFLRTIKPWGARRKWNVKGIEFNLRSKVHLTQLLRSLGMKWDQITEKSERPQLNLDVVNKLRRAYPQHEPLLRILWEYAKLEKLRGDWLEDSDGHRLLCDDQRLRASVRVCGTASGRFSEAGRDWCAPCLKPEHGRNRQNLPRTDDEFCATHAPIRAMVIPPPGRALVKADYSGLEAWIGATLSGDGTFLERLRSGDIHTANARDLLTIPPSEPIAKDDQRRTLAKIFLYGGVLYKGGPGVIQASFERAGIIIPLAEVAIWQSRWKVRHQRFVNWQSELIAKACHSRPYRVETALGRQRLFWGKPASWDKEAIAHVISGTGAGYTNEAFIELGAAWEGTTHKILMHEHDGIIAECDVDAIDSVAGDMQAAFERNRAIGVFRCEVKWSTTNLQEMHAWELKS